MKRNTLLLISILFLSQAASSQWLAKATFPGIPKAKSAAFTIGTKIYVLGGVEDNGIILNDFWEYDMVTDTWTQKPAFPGPERYGASSFVINNKGYVATGGNDNGYLDDLWEYNPATGAWIQKTGLPAGQPQHENQRREAYSFVIGNKAYLGGGEGFSFGANSTLHVAFSDLWEYDPAVDSWSQKAHIPDLIGRTMTVSGTINNKGYVGLGCDVSQIQGNQTFWEYDAGSDSWTGKAIFPNLFATDAGGFVLNGNFYVTGGVSLTPLGVTNEVHRYDPASNSWTALPNFSGGAIAGEFAVSTGTRAFIGTGYSNIFITRNDFWEMTFPAAIQDDNLIPSQLATVYVDFSGDLLTVKSNRSLSGSAYSISDLSGRAMRKGIIAAETTSIDIRDLSSGIYVVTFNNLAPARKFLKN